MHNRFHVVKLGGDALDEVRRRVQQAICGHRGRNGDPLYRIHTSLRAGAERLTDGQWPRRQTCLPDGDPNDEVTVAWAATRNCAGSTTNPTWPRPGANSRRDHRHVPHLPDPPRSPASAGPYADGPTSPWPTSPPAGRTTDPPKRSTDLSNCTAGSPAATATPPTTGSG
jgi:hypothetical protein